MPIEQPDILLVEDNPRDAELTMRALEKRNLANQILWVKDGAEALEVLLGNASPVRPKVVLLDLKLPKLDGLEVLRELKSNPASKTIPVIVLTSSREEGDQVKSYELGVNSYIVKPVDFESFSDAIAQVGLYWLILNENPFHARSSASR